VEPVAAERPRSAFSRRRVTLAGFPDLRIAESFALWSFSPTAERLRYPSRLCCEARGRRGFCPEPDHILDLLLRTGLPQGIPSPIGYRTRQMRPRRLRRACRVFEARSRAGQRRGTQHDDSQGSGLRVATSLDRLRNRSRGQSHHRRCGFRRRVSRLGRRQRARPGPQQPSGRRCAFRGSLGASGLAAGGGWLDHVPDLPLCASGIARRLRGASARFRRKTAGAERILHQVPPRH